MDGNSELVGTYNRKRQVTMACFLLNLRGEYNVLITHYVTWHLRWQPERRRRSKRRILRKNRD